MEESPKILLVSTGTEVPGELIAALAAKLNCPVDDVIVMVDQLRHADALASGQYSIEKTAEAFQKLCDEMKKVPNLSMSLLMKPEKNYITGKKLPRRKSWR